ncbi:MAG: HK97 family phage prohead protease, partial [Candidatus Riesia sp.]|nr:HK97 family phage prohead protease [Candidatus Riesia sp.]
MPTTSERLNRLKELRVDFSSDFIIKADTPSEEEVLYIEGFASTDTVDRDNDIIPMSSWADPDAIKNYLKNPIVLAHHKRDMPVGTCEYLEAKDGGLFVKVKLVKSVNSEIYSAVKNGILKTFSVGFRLNDLEYDEELDSFILTKVELTEISIVSIPCNPDATFAVIKSLTSKQNQEKRKMPEAKQDELKQAVQAELDRIEAEKTAALAAKQKQEQEQATVAQLIAEQVKTATAEQTTKLLADIKAALGDEQKSLSDVIKQFKEDIDANKEAVIAAQNSKMEHPVNSATKAGPVSDAEKGYAVLLGIITKKDTFSTKLGAELKQKAAGFNGANAAVHIPGSHTVNAAEWETTFVTDLWYDVRRELVIEPMFRAISMTSAVMKMPVVPEQGYASYIAVDALKTVNSTAAVNSGNRPLEITLTAHKLSAADLVGEEETEDTIIAILPLIRDNLVRRMARSSDRSLLRGVGATAADPIKGLAQYAIDNSKETTLSIGGGDKLTALKLQQTRRLLGVYGTRPSDVVYIVST